MSSKLNAFEPRHCNCQQCLSPCRQGPPGALAPMDMIHIAGHIGIEPEQGADFAFKMFDACQDGPRTSTADEPDTPTPCFRPKQKPDGRCVFLGDDDRCLIYEVRPYGCSRVNQCQPEESAGAMKALGIAIAESSFYVRQWLQLYNRRKEADEHAGEKTPQAQDTTADTGGPANTD